jgi:hypothetical protein
MGVERRPELLHDADSVKLLLVYVEQRGKPTHDQTKTDPNIATTNQPHKCAQGASI